MADPITQVVQSLGLVTAYGYAKSKGYTGTEEEFAEAAAAIGQGAATATAAAEAASEDAETATTAAGTATTAAGNAENSATAALQYMNNAETAATNAGTAQTAAAGSATSAAASAQAAATSEYNAGVAAGASSDYALDSQDHAEDSEAWAVGTKNGNPVSETADQYNNNAKYYAEQTSTASGTATGAAQAAADSAAQAEAWATGGSGGTASATNNAEFWAAQAAASAEDAETAAVAGTAALANEAPTFDATKAYSAGEYVLYNSVLYRFTADHAAGAWTGTDATAVKVGGEVSDLRDTFKLSVGARQIDFTYGQYINTNSQNIGAEVALTPVTNVSLAYAIVTCSEGESLILNARGYTSGRLWAFLTAENNLISRSAQSVTASNLVVPVPKNAAKCVINTFISGIGCCVVGNNPSVETPKLYAKIDNDFDGKLGVLNDSIFELGSINITNNGWTYQAATDRVRLKQDVVLHVNIGDVIGLTSYSGYRWYLGLLDDDDGQYYKAGWFSGDWASTHNGRCAIMIRKDPSADIEDYRELARLFKGYPAINYVQDNYVDVSDALLLDHDYLVKSINHRGYRDEAPENTIPAFKISRKKGFQYVETDIAFTSDNIPVLLHDSTINRTARNADGTAVETSIPIDSLTYEQALQYVFCGNHYGRYPTVRIPTLAEFMVLCRNIGICPYLELKHEVGTTSQIQSCVEIVKEAGMLSHTTWISFDVTMLEIIKNYSPTSRIGWLVQTPPITQSNVERIQTLKTGTNDVFIIGGNYTSQEVEMCKNANIPLEAGTTGKADIPNLPAYVHGVLTEGVLAGQILFSKSIEI